MTHTPMEAAAIIMNGELHLETAFGAKSQAGIAAIISDTTAAPELLEALQLAQATIERLKPHTHGPFSSVDGTLDVIRAAIAKATEEAK